MSKNIKKILTSILTITMVLVFLPVRTQTVNADTIRVYVGGKPFVGETLEAIYIGDEELSSISYQWVFYPNEGDAEYIPANGEYQDPVNIEGQTSKTYTVEEKYLGHTITVDVLINDNPERLLSQGYSISNKDDFKLIECGDTDWEYSFHRGDSNWRYTSNVENDLVGSFESVVFYNASEDKKLNFPDGSTSHPKHIGMTIDKDLANFYMNYFHKTNAITLEYNADTNTVTVSLDSSKDKSFENSHYLKYSVPTDAPDTIVAKDYYHLDENNEPSVVATLTLLAKDKLGATGEYNLAEAKWLDNDGSEASSDLGLIPLTTYEYYKGTEKLMSPPSEEGTYTVKAILNDEDDNELCSISKEFHIVDGSPKLVKEDEGDLTVSSNKAIATYTVKETVDSTMHIIGLNLADMYKNADKYEGVYVTCDGESLEENVNYELTDGSVKVNLKKSYLDTLPVGEHAISVYVKDGEAATDTTYDYKFDATITIEAKSAPTPTPTPSNPKPYKAPNTSVR